MDTYPPSDLHSATHSDRYHRPRPEIRIAGLVVQLFGGEFIPAVKLATPLANKYLAKRQILQVLTYCTICVCTKGSGTEVVGVVEILKNCFHKVKLMNIF
jgi:hypothetical protein